MQKDKKQLYFTNVPKNKISFLLDVYNKATGQSEKVFITGTTRGVAALIKSIMNSDYKTASIKSLNSKELENGKVVADFDFGAKGDIRNLNVQLNEVRFKWHTIDRETGEKSKDYTVKMSLFAQRDENKKVHWGKTPEAETAIMKKLEGLIKALEDRNSQEVRIGINFVEGKDGKKRAYVDYIGMVKVPEKEISNKDSTKEQEIKKPEPADPDIPF